jgi:RNA polymerase sigma-B factor
MVRVPESTAGDLSFAVLGQLPDADLLARYRGHAPGSPQRDAACEVLVRRYTPLVRACVRAYLNSPESSEDLMQVGYVGLLKAIRGFDPAFGNELSAYATPCVTGEVKRHFRDKRWQVRVARPLQELLLDARGADEELRHELGREPQESELAARLGVTPGKLREARQAAGGQTALSLDAPVGDGEDSAGLGELLGEQDAAFEQAAGMAAVEEHWDELPHREQQILLMRYWGNSTQEQVAAKLGISQMHVSRLQARALAWLRERLVGPAEAPAPGTAGRMA